MLTVALCKVGSESVEGVSRIAADMARAYRAMQSDIVAGTCDQVVPDEIRDALLAIDFSNVDLSFVVQDGEILMQMS